MNVLLISTTTHQTSSTSQKILQVLKYLFEAQGCRTKFINADELHIVKNLSCYASGKMNCASYDAGRYRCWAHKLSHDNPEQYGGRDEMPVLYEGFDWADVVVFGTSTRWESHSALLQKIIERMTNLQNRNVVYGEPNPLAEKKCGVVVTGHNAKSQSVASHLLEVFQWLGFDTNIFYQIVWQKTDNLHSEVPEKTDLPALEDYFKTPDARQMVSEFVTRLLG